MAPAPAASAPAGGWRAEVRRLRGLRRQCRAVGCAFAPAAVRRLGYRLRGKNLATADGVTIHGLGNLVTEPGGRLDVGLEPVGFMDRGDRTLLRLRGRLEVAGPFTIARGCRLDVGPDAVVRLAGGYFNARTTLVIAHGLTVGAGCAVSWDCQFLDEDFHALDYDGRRPPADPRITLGDRVWVGSGVTVLKGSSLPDGTVVAAGAVVAGRFTEPNTLLGGVPAKALRRGVSWR